MCGRFANHIPNLRQWANIIRNWPADVVTGYNVAPTQLIPAFTAEGGQAMRWSLIPPWSKEASSKFATFNARVETMAEKPAFRHAWKHAQRCLVPVLGYYEWRAEDSRKQPYFVTTKEGSPLVLAGLWEPQRDDLPASCTVITQAADPAMARLHERMPLFVPRDNVERWLEEEPEAAAETIQHWRRPDLRIYAVSTAVNNGRAQGEALIAPLDKE